MQAEQTKAPAVGVSTLADFIYVYNAPQTIFNDSVVVKCSEETQRISLTKLPGLVRAIQ